MTGRLIALEGIGGSGKTTIARRTADWLRLEGRAVLETKEPGGTPGGTPIGDVLRGILLDRRRYGDLTPVAQTLGFELDRAITAANLIGPALDRGEWVVSDRHHFGTIAYQSFGGGVPIELVDLLNDAVLGDRYPDLSVVLDLPIELASQRRADRAAIDRFDEMDQAFQQRVREGYRFAAARRGARAVVIDASQSAEAVFVAAQAAITPLLS